MVDETLQTVTLDDKYTLESGRVFISGTQALVRLPIMQRQRDRAVGLNTAGFISGYRGSPLGGYDGSLSQASHLLQANDIVFRPGVNEDQAATAVWGTQQLDFLPGKKVDGVFAIWYGKGPGVDRSGDPLKHANFQGTHPNGGVLVVFGDDHPGKSSTLAHQSEQALAAHGIPVLYPSSPQDYLDYGLYGFAMSRFAGTLVGFKVVNETVMCTATVDVDPLRPEIVLPASAPMPEGGVSARNEYAPPEQDARLVRYKLPRVQAFARENKLDRTTFGTEGKKRLGIVTAGKAYLDTLAALRLLGIGQEEAEELRIGVYKVAMVWPLEPENLKAFAATSDELLFVEEKRAVMEDQAKSILYGEAQRPRIYGKRDESGEVLLPEDVQIEAATIAQAIAHRLEQLGPISRQSVVAAIGSLRELLDTPQAAANMGVVRMPYFCSGCPHNTSTKLPDGSFAMAGIGCHGMAMLTDRKTLSGTHMGGEGVNWTGLAPFTNTPHVFQNLGDGTYYHSGILAIRAAVQASVNITYKILYNDAVAMTGGQKHDGPLSVDIVVGQVLAEGVRKVAVVSDDPKQFERQPGIPDEVRVYHRDDLDTVQREMREVEGTTVIVYEQTCAAEKRRRRKRNEFPDLPKRAFINAAVCEGCGDCSVQANCVSIHPLDTTFGRKRKIDQSSCNKDYSCVKGFCPSFVTVYGGELRRPSAVSFGDDSFSSMPAPAMPESDGNYSVIVAGIGGTGVVTIAALLGMAAHLEGKGASVFDMTGLSQKNGAVYSHLWLLDDPAASAPAKVGLAEANLILGCDLVAAAGTDAMQAVKTGTTRAILNSAVVPTASFQTDRDMNIDGQMLERSINEKVGDSRAHIVDASKFALKLLGNTIGANVFLIGFALQKGCIPLTLDAIERAIELNGVSVEFNLRALKLGRLAAVDPARVESLLPTEARSESVQLNTPDELIAHRRAALVNYQDEAYAARYSNVIETARRAENALGKTGGKFTTAVARNAYKVMAYKDEYAVAQMFTDGAFEKSVADTFEGDYKLRFHLAPPLLSRRDPVTGEARKSEYGSWVFRAFRILAKLKGFRGTRLDIFGYTAERQHERALRDEYLADIERLAASLTLDSLPTAVAIAEIPDQIRGYGHVKQRAMTKVKSLREKLFSVVDRSREMEKAA